MTPRLSDLPEWVRWALVFLVTGLVFVIAITLVSNMYSVVAYARENGITNWSWVPAVAAETLLAMATAAYLVALFGRISKIPMWLRPTIWGLSGLIVVNNVVPPLLVGDWPQVVLHSVGPICYVVGVEILSWLIASFARKLTGEELDQVHFVHWFVDPGEAWFIVTRKRMYPWSKAMCVEQYQRLRGSTVNRVRRGLVPRVWRWLWSGSVVVDLDRSAGSTGASVDGRSRMLVDRSGSVEVDRSAGSTDGGVVEASTGSAVEPSTAPPAPSTKTASTETASTGGTSTDVPVEPSTALSAGLGETVNRSSSTVEQHDRVVEPPVEPVRSGSVEMPGEGISAACSSVGPRVSVRLPAVAETRGHPEVPDGVDRSGSVEVDRSAGSTDGGVVEASTGSAVEPSTAPPAPSTKTASTGATSTEVPVEPSTVGTADPKNAVERSSGTVGVEERRGSVDKTDPAHSVDTDGSRGKVVQLGRRPRVPDEEMVDRAVEFAQGLIGSGRPAGEIGLNTLQKEFGGNSDRWRTRIYPAVHARVPGIKTPQRRSAG
ncbi:hypothetical protein [Streptomyces sp. S1D4-20]|uniref:hypothetical protein n=1 Tax=Streptomyces sp. S1D4-20 TaxID=2594462 RepID=UPI0011654E6F|nr:hypothetical protein [Streptomyces sp. S1D4-20]QDN54210.1 hypothetical protein FNV67_01175 [Streptomyces sp. S1D4-20]